MVTKRDIHLQADSKPLNNIPAGTSKSTTDWFASDIVPIDLQEDEVGRIRIWVSIDTTDIVKYTTDGGTSFKAVNSGVALAVNSEFAFDVRVTSTSLFNIQFNTVTANVECFVDQVNKE